MERNVLNYSIRQKQEGGKRKALLFLQHLASVKLFKQIYTTLTYFCFIDVFIYIKLLSINEVLLMFHIKSIPGKSNVLFEMERFNETFEQRMNAFFRCTDALKQKQNV